MGCTASRSEKRNEDLDDYNQLDVALMGGDGRPLDKNLCPVDKLFLAYSYEKAKAQGVNSAFEPYEVFRINNKGEIDNQYEELITTRVKDIIGFLDGLKKHIHQEGRGVRDFKKVLIGQKYETKDALAYLTVVINKL